MRVPKYVVELVMSKDKKITETVVTKPMFEYEAEMVLEGCDECFVDNDNYYYYQITKIA